jgi:hypothetical protein
VARWWLDEFDQVALGILEVGKAKSWSARIGGLGHQGRAGLEKAVKARLKIVDGKSPVEVPLRLGTVVSITTWPARIDRKNSAPARAPFSRCSK